MEEIIIHKVAFKDEAVFDYEHCLPVRNFPWDETDTDWQLESKYDLPLVRLPKFEMKRELEEYIQTHSKNKYKHYFRVRYYDETFDRELMLFIRRGEICSIMQNWYVVGICFADDWTEDDEDEGKIRAWVDTSTTNLPADDWVEEKRHYQQLREMIFEKEEKRRERYERLFA